MIRLTLRRHVLLALVLAVFAMACGLLDTQPAFAKGKLIGVEGRLQSVEENALLPELVEVHALVVENEYPGRDLNFRKMENICWQCRPIQTGCQEIVASALHRCLSPIQKTAKGEQSCD